MWILPAADPGGSSWPALQERDGRGRYDKADGSPWTASRRDTIPSLDNLSGMMRLWALTQIRVIEIRGIALIYFRKIL